MNKKTTALLIFIVFMIVAIGLGIYLVSQQQQIFPKADESLSPSPPVSPPASGIMCPADARACPNGSYVSRTGANCEFATCPTSVSPSPSVSPSAGPTNTPNSSPTSVPNPTATRTPTTTSTVGPTAQPTEVALAQSATTPTGTVTPTSASTLPSAGSSAGPFFMAITGMIVITLMFVF